MSVRCEPPEGLRDQPGFHYVRVNRAEVVMAWETYAPGQDWRWRSWGRSVAPDSETARAWTYICPVPTPAEIAAQADAIERFEEDVMLFGRGYLSGKKEGVVRQVSPLAVPAERAAPPMTALLPCPFCGGRGLYSTSQEGAFVMCGRCDGRSQTHLRETPAKILAASWNRRAVPPCPAAPGVSGGLQHDPQPPVAAGGKDVPDAPGQDDAAV